MATKQDNEKIIWVMGNRQQLIIPMEKEVVPAQGEPYTEDFYPAEDDVVKVTLTGSYRPYIYTPEVDGHLLILTEPGTLPRGLYGVIITVSGANGETRLRSFWDQQIVVTERNNSVLKEWDEFKDQPVTARAAVFFFAKGDPFTYDDFTPEQLAELKKPATDAAAEVAALEQNIEAAEQTRQQNETTRTTHETSRQNAEDTRQQNEQQRINQEQARQQNESSRTTTFNADHTTATSDHQTATSDHQTAAADHQTATSDHQTAAADHTQAELDHTTATSDHTQAGTDHQTAAADHTQAGTDHQTAAADHTQAGNDHTRAESDHGIAAADHQTATSDHQTAAADHTQAGTDHQTAAADHTQAGTDHTASSNATTAANSAAELANTKAGLAAEKAALADEKATEAGRVNATISGTTLTITDRDGQSTSVDTKGSDGAPGPIGPKICAIDFGENGDTFQMTNVFGYPMNITRIAGVNITKVKLSYGTTLNQEITPGTCDVTIADGQVLTIKAVRTSDLQGASVSMRFGLVETT